MAELGFGQDDIDAVLTSVDGFPERIIAAIFDD
jgi:hypothetical protein